jgi:hypothetical protein
MGEKGVAFDGRRKATILIVRRVPSDPIISKKASNYPVDQRSFRLINGT